MNANTVGGSLVALGAAGVAIITGIYASAPTLASAPLPAGSDIAAVIAATLELAGRLQLAGGIGLVADILLIGGCAVLALRPGEALGKQLLWIWLGLSTAIFIVVDGLASEALVPLAAASTDGTAAFVFARGAYDAAFALGCGTFGAGYIAAYFARDSWNAGIRYLTLVAGALGVIAFGLHLAGITVPLLMGASVGLAGIAGVIVGAAEIRRTTMSAAPVPA